MNLRMSTGLRVISAFCGSASIVHTLCMLQERKISCDEHSRNEKKNNKFFEKHEMRQTASAVTYSGNRRKSCAWQVIVMLCLYRRNVSAISCQHEHTHAEHNERWQGA